MRKFLLRTMLSFSVLLAASATVSAQMAVKSGVATPQARTMTTAQVGPIDDAMPRTKSNGSSYLLPVAASSNSSVAGLLSPQPSVKEQIRQATGGITMIGNVLFSDPLEGQTTGSARLGIYEFMSDGSSWNPLVAGAPACNSAVAVNGVYYNFYTEVGAILTRYYVKKYSLETWDELGQTTITNAKLPRALCTNGTTVYGCFYNGQTGDASGFEFGVLDLTSYTHTVICALPRNWNACAYGNDGFIYAIDMGGDLLKVTPTTGDIERIGATGKVPKYISSACIEQKSGRMFWTLSPEDLRGYLCEVNLTTGAATVIHNFKYNEEVGGLYIPFLAYDKAPAAVTNLTTSFIDGSLSGQVKFKCPTTLFDGTATTGALKYTILANDKELATGDCAFGQEMSVDVTVASSNNYTITVIVTNDAGNSPKTKTSLFIGKDRPQTPNVSLTYSGGKMHVSWNKVTESVNGGYMDPANVKYNVYRYPDGASVAKSITDTIVEDAVSEPDTYTLYYYTVMAICDGTYSAIGESNYIGLGSVKAPYKETFDNVSSMDYVTIIDANNDGRTWQYDAANKCARMMYSLTLDMDDWIVTPPLYLEKGKAYTFSSDFRNYDATKYPEKAEVKMGRQPTAAAMTTTLVETTTFTGKEWTTVSSYIIPDETGIYYIGLHSQSVRNSSFYIYADNISVVEIESTVPAAPELEVVPDNGGGLSAVVKGKAPATTLSGSALASITKLEIKRDGEIVKTYTDLTPGADFSFNETGLTQGEHTWSAVCYNAMGAGKPVEVKSYIGVDRPAAVTDVVMTETSPGKVHISWTAPTLDASGKPLGNNPITYVVAKGSNILAQGLTTTSFDYTVNTTGQDFFQPIIYAYNATGLSAGTYAPFFAVGTPFRIPYIESFPGGDAPSYLLGVFRVNGGQPNWGLCYDGYMNINSADNDNGYMSAKFAAVDDASMIFTGKIDLTTAANPAVSVYTYNINNGTNDNLNELDIVVREANTTDWISVKKGTIHEICNGDTSVWRSVKTSLRDYKGKVVQIGIQGTCKGYAWFLVDRIVLSDELTNNLGLTAIDAPQTSKPNVPFTIQAKVENLGANIVSDYTVEFYRTNDAVPFYSVKGTSVAPGASKTFSTTSQLGFADEDAEGEYYAVVKYAADENADDNTSSRIKVRRIYSEKTSPTALTATGASGEATLTWTAPDVSNTGGNIDDNCESYKSWDYTGAGNWIFLDRDLGPRGGFQTLEIPDNPQKSKGSFFVFEQDGVTFNSSFAAHSGKKFFASIFNIDASTVDDWLISPILDESEQTIKFWAKSYSSTYPEVMEILYSTTDADPSHFTSVQKVSAVPGDWTEYAFTVPAGAKFFAVRNNGGDKFMLMLDDFTFKAGKDVPVGYNVYRDGVKITASPVAATTFKDTNVAEGDHRYDVTAVYVNGEESAPASCTINVSTVSTLPVGVTITAGRGYIDIFGAEGKNVIIFNAHGIEVTNVVPSGDMRIQAESGIYMVRVDKGYVKVMVK